MSSEPLMESLQDSASRPRTSSRQATLRIHDPRDRAAWQAWSEAWVRCAQADAFSHPSYLVDRAHPGEKPLAADFDDGHGSRVLFAFLLRPIVSDALGRAVAEECYDITTPLLYGGPQRFVAAGTHEETLLTSFWEHFRQWAQDNRVVSEFHRENPVADPSPGYPGQRTEHAGHVVKELEGRSEAEIFGDTSKSFRRTVRRAEAAGTDILIDETGARIDDFLDLYYATMDRNSAAASFYFPREHFDMLNSTFAGRITYLYALEAGRPTSAELLLQCSDIGYSLLGATAEAGLLSGANSLLSLRAFLYARSRGIRHYVLTGGVTNSDDDSLLRYKLSMAKSGLRRYFTASQVTDEHRYEQLNRGHDTECGFFPGYRCPRCEQGRAGIRTTEVES